MKKRITFDEDYESWQVDGKYLQAGTYKMEFVTVGYNQLFPLGKLVAYGDDSHCCGKYYDISNFINTCKSLNLTNLIERYLKKSNSKSTIDIDSCNYVTLTDYEVDKLKTVYRDEVFKSYADGIVIDLYKLCSEFSDKLSPGIYECYIEVDDIFTYVDIKNMALHFPNFNPDDWEVYLLLDEDV